MQAFGGGGGIFTSQFLHVGSCLFVYLGLYAFFLSFSILHLLVRLHVGTYTLTGLHVSSDLHLQVPI